jgi:hypothetical protein
MPNSKTSQTIGKMRKSRWDFFSASKMKTEPSKWMNKLSSNSLDYRISNNEKPATTANRN